MLSGRLDTLSVLEVLVLLQRSSSTGVLQVSGPDHAVVFCTDGAVTLAASHDAAQAHDTLVQPGLIEPDEWPGVAGDGHALGEMIAERGVDQERYLNYLRHSIEEAVFELSLWSEGEFAFSPDHAHPLGNVIGYPIDDLLAAVDIRAKAWEGLLGRLPGLDAIAEPAAFLPGEQDSVTLTRAQFRVLSMLDGATTVFALSRTLGDGIFTTTEVLVELVDAGLARFRDGEASKAPAKKGKKKAAAAAPSAAPAAQPAVPASNGTQARPAAAPTIAPVGGVDMASPNEKPDRSLVLRLLSAVKELEVSEGGA